MRYGLIADDLLEGAALATGVLPFPLLDVLLPLVQARALMCAAKLGIFSSVGSGSKTVEELLRDCGTSRESTIGLLRVLECAGYVRSRGGRYWLTARARKSMVPGSPSCLAGYVEFNYVQWDWIAGMEDVIRSGRGLDVHARMRDPSSWWLYQRAMLETAARMAPHVAPLVPIKHRARALLDVAGSHGMYGALICRLHPPMRSVVLELPDAVASAASLAAQAGIQDVVTHRAGNLRTDGWEAGWDAIFLGQIAHHLDDADLRAVLDRSLHTLSADGTVAIWDIEARRQGDKPDLVADAMSLFFQLTSTSTCRSAADYATFLHDAGFHHIRVRRTKHAPGQVLVTARR
ncbi:MAG: methyltransferase [Myxococcota bacterium]